MVIDKGTTLNKKDALLLQIRVSKKKLKKISLDPIRYTASNIWRTFVITDLWSVSFVLKVAKINFKHLRNIRSINVKCHSIRDCLHQFNFEQLPPVKW